MKIVHKQHIVKGSIKGERLVSARAPTAHSLNRRQKNCIIYGNRLQKRLLLLSCQLSNVTLVEVCWERFYPSMKA
jgi:hypothetical protein